LNLGDFMELYKIDNRLLKYEGFTPRISSFFREEDNAFRAIKNQDIFYITRFILFHP